MQEKDFQTFREAADYARRQSEKNGLTVKVVRVGESWRVASGLPGGAHSAPRINEKRSAAPSQTMPNVMEALGRKVPEGAHYSWETRSYISSEMERVSIERQKEEERRLEARIAAIGPSVHNDHRRLLEETYRRFSEMSDEELTQSWEKSRAQGEEEPSEEARVLRAVVRKRWGISTPDAKDIEVCAKCYQPRSQCVCDPVR